MSCRTTMENLGNEIYRDKQREKEIQEQEDLIDFWLGTDGRKLEPKPNLTQIGVQTIEPWVGKEFAKKFDEMNRNTNK